MKPNNEQVTIFWEWCGVKRKDMGYKHRTGFNYHGKVHEYEHDTYHWILYDDSLPTGGVDFGLDLPPIDLNHIFEYALPHVEFALVADVDRENKRFYSAEVIVNRINDEVIDDDPALALFWAIYGVIKNEKRND